jgi:hypothetical protein
MICFDVAVNGEHLATAGLPGFNVLTTHICWVQRPGEKSGQVDVSVSGLDANHEEGDHY